MREDRDSVDNHDFSDFDDLFADQDDDFDPAAALDEARSGSPAKSSSTTDNGSPPSSTQPDGHKVEADDINALIDEIMDDESIHDSTHDSPHDRDSADATPAADGSSDSLAADDELQLDQEWDDVVTTDDDAAQVAESGQDGSLIADDEMPDIDFLPDSENSDSEISGDNDQAADGDAVEELENFDDFIIDDDEETIAPEFGEQTALDPPSDAGDSSDPLSAEQEFADPAPSDSATAESTVSDPAVFDQSVAADGAADEWSDNGVADHDLEPDQQADVQAEEEDPAVKQSNMIALVAGAVALVASMGGLWLGYSVKAELAQMPAQAAPGSSPLDDAKLKGIEETLSQVDGRITKLSTRVASFGAMHGGSTDPKVEALDGRTARLEQLVSDIKEEIGHLRHQIAEQPQRPSAARRVVKRRGVERVKPAAKPKLSVKAATAHSGGGWFVNLTSHTSKRSAQQQVKQMARKGITAESKRVVVKGRIYYRVRIAGFASRSQSLAFKAMLAKKYHITDSWVSNY
ncbi:MAG: SPOR domain-containing protein [Mariprofundales bacterium]|nr:SPOR domain-containing protein [Mariprofundales bacterium]